VQKLTVQGLASQKESSLIVTVDDLTLSLIDFLIKNQIPVASSCSGEGICKKCVINEEILSCQITVKEFLLKKINVKINYL
jgi:hypothetical protein